MATGRQLLIARTANDDVTILVDIEVGIPKAPYVEAFRFVRSGRRGRIGLDNLGRAFWIQTVIVRGQGARHAHARSMTAHARL